jgi:hypothetical protein
MGCGARVHREGLAGVVEKRSPEAWVGKVAQLWVIGEDEPWLGVLEAWNERGVVLRYGEGVARFEASRGDRALGPMMMLFPWSAVRFVGVDLEELEGGERSPEFG